MHLQAWLRTEFVGRVCLKERLWTLLVPPAKGVAPVCFTVPGHMQQKDREVHQTMFTGLRLPTRMGVCGPLERPVHGSPRRDRFCRPLFTPPWELWKLRSCVCKRRYLRNSWGECIPRLKCIPCKFKWQRDYRTCAPGCPATCHRTFQTSCNVLCRDGCVCPPGWVVHPKYPKKCVKAQKCLPRCPPPIQVTKPVSPLACLMDLARGRVPRSEGFPATTTAAISVPKNEGAASASMISTASGIHVESGGPKGVVPVCSSRYREQLPLGAQPEVPEVVYEDQ
ncbi:hypothetical protein MRX96_025609 [Rhipicephalus microplus]